MGVYECLVVFMGVYEFLRVLWVYIFTGLYGCLWVFMSVNGCL